MDPIYLVGALILAVLAFGAGFLVAAHNAKQAAAAQSAIAAVHATVAEVKGLVSAQPAAAPGGTATTEKAI